MTELTAAQRRLVRRLRWGVFWSSTKQMPGMQEEAFLTLAEANAAARALFGRMVDHYGGRVRSHRPNPFAAALSTSGQPLRVWVARVGLDDSFEEGPVLRYRDPAGR